ncbi:calpain clp-1-like [Penaeus monodon]|uniref:calpain clp-1-like n=1 Tax=Penaeus monodon TaxID=6687 RepID=UPI0018A7D53B|nr:calpain clp-1-like [Penaeus monodon]
MKRHRLSSVFSQEELKEVHKFGERGSGLRPRGEVQDFYSLRQQCLDGGTLFEDHDFPAEDSSIFFSRAPPKPFEWKRPHVSPYFVM